MQLVLIVAMVAVVGLSYVMLRQVEQVGPQVIWVHCSTTMENIELIQACCWIRMLKYKTFSNCVIMFSLYQLCAFPQW